MTKGLTDLDYVLEKLHRMEASRIWPNGKRYLWTDAFGVVLLVSLYSHLKEAKYLTQAEHLVGEVDRVLGRRRGIRIGEAADRDGQYFHYLAMWLYALAMLGRHRRAYVQRGVALVREIHDAFVIPGRGVLWKMREDLSAPYPGYGFGALDAFDGYVAYRLLDANALAREIDAMRALIDATYRDLYVTQDLGIGMLLWLSHFFPEESWARLQRERCLATLDRMWCDDHYFCRQPGARDTKFAFTNYGVSIGLQAVGARPERVRALNRFFDGYRSGDEYDFEAITHVMACSSHFPGLLLANDFTGNATRGATQP
jgi:hypothetical protein